MSGAGLRIGVLGSGKGSNCEAILTGCRQGKIPGEVVLVLSDVADSGILALAGKYDVPARVVTPKPEEPLIAALKDAGVELVALAGYMRVLKEQFLREFAGRIVNVHPSLLPAFPGLRAWEQALQYGARLTGATVHFVTEGAVDAGPVILQHPVPVFANDTAESLHARIQIAEHTLYPEAIRLFAEGKLRVEGRRVRILE